jgi:hypothetical protein
MDCITLFDDSSFLSVQYCNNLTYLNVRLIVVSHSPVDEHPNLMHDYCTVYLYRPISCPI